MLKPNWNWLKTAHLAMLSFLAFMDAITPRSMAWE